jgi:hypothetical protein
MKRKNIFLQMVLTIVIILPGLSQESATDTLFSITDTLDKDFGLFTNDEVLNLSLWFNISEYIKKKPKEDYLDAILTYYLSPADSINKKIRLRSRGEFRNGYCDFPPLVLNFKKTDFAMTDLNKLEKMKVVTHCKYGSEENLFREYLIYRLYQELTDKSFRVRLIHITYHNTAKVKKPVQTYAFFIEPLGLLAERLGMIPVESLNLTQRNILPEAIDRVAIFNYMIGNTDWSVPNQHNCKILMIPNSERPDLGMIVPYDFDYSGLVNADYAVPAEGLRIESVRERIYLGRCRTEEEHLKSLMEFSEKKEEFYRVIQDFSLIHEKTRKEMIRYLDEFFEGFDKQNTVMYELLQDCQDY